MKRIILFLTLLLIQFNGFSQEQEGSIEEETNYRVFLGYNLLVHKESNNPFNSFGLPFTMSFQASKPISKDLFVDFELGYFNSGFETTYTTLSSTGKALSLVQFERLKNLKFLTNIDYKFNDHLSIYLGPSLVYIIDANRLNTGSAFEESSSIPENANVKDRYKDFDLGLNFGLQYNISEHVLLDLNFYSGLLNIRKPNNKSAKNGLVSLQLGYKI